MTMIQFLNVLIVRLVLNVPVRAQLMQIIRLYLMMMVLSPAKILMNAKIPTSAQSKIPDVLTHLGTLAVHVSLELIMLLTT